MAQRWIPSVILGDIPTVSCKIIDMKNRRKSKNCIFPVLLCAFFLSLLPRQAFAVSQWEIDEVKRKRDLVAEQRNAQQQIVDNLTGEQNSVIDEKLALEQSVSLTREQIDLNNQEIALYDGLIQEKIAEVEAAKALEDEQLERYRVRVRAMEENGVPSLLVMLSESDSLRDLLTALDDVGAIMESDRALEDQYIAARKAHEKKQAEYEEVRVELLAHKSVLEEERKQLELQIDTAQEKIEELQQQITENEALVAEIEARWQELDQRVGELQAQYEKERAPGNISGDGFIWPCSANIITSLAGTRTHPVTGQERYHSGVDIGCPAGDPVWAAASGTVSSAGWNGNYGNCVMISHDNGYTTVYGHLDSIAVSSGQSVSAGTTVGYCGSTGLATGPHLHFEIRSGGDFLDPLDFFSGGSFVYMLDA